MAHNFRNKLWLIIIGVIAAVALLTGIGFAAETILSSANIQHASSRSAYFNNTPGVTSSGSQGAVFTGPSQPATSANTPYTGNALYIKTSTLTISVNNPLTAYNQISQWIERTDTHAVTTGVTIDNNDPKNIFVNVSFSVESTLYPQIVQYLQTFGAGNGGRLLSDTETSQDVTQQYVDTQARLSSLQTELARLQELVAKAQSVADIITIDQEITNLETQLNQTESELNALSNQVTMYTVQVNLVPLTSVVPPASNTPWSFMGSLQDAWNAFLAFGKLLITGFIWVGVFAIYIVPIGFIVWYAFRFTRKRNASQSQQVS